MIFRSRLRNTSRRRWGQQRQRDRSSRNSRHWLLRLRSFQIMSGYIYYPRLPTPPLFRMPFVSRWQNLWLFVSWFQSQSKVNILIVRSTGNPVIDWDPYGKTEFNGKTGGQITGQVRGGDHPGCRGVLGNGAPEDTLCTNSQFAFFLRRDPCRLVWWIRSRIFGWSAFGRYH